MTATASYGVTGDPYLDGVMSGIKWGVTNLTFSFPVSGGYYGTYGSGENLNAFEAFTPQQTAAVRDILKMYSAVSNLTFSELTESSTVHADLRYAESDSTNTAWAYYPSTSAVGGDAWFNNSKNYYDAPVPGNYAWLTMMHETGHALGLKHPHEARGSFGGLPADHDSLEYSVMSYRSYVGASTTSGYTNGNGNYPQTLMMHDIAAIQKLYGANFATNAGDTVYGWNPTTGAMSVGGVAGSAPATNKIFMTLWDGGGNDTYSFASYASGVAVDLQPGAWTTASAAQLASLGSGKVAIGNIANALQYAGDVASLIENAVGGSGADNIYGNAAANKLTGGAGSDLLNGRTGTDTAVYSGAKTDYSWFHNADDSWTVADLRSGSPNGTDTLWNMEFLQFTDGFVELGPSSNAVVDPEPPLVIDAKPTGNSNSYSTKINKKLVVNVNKGVLNNDVDPEGGQLTAELVSGPSKGKLMLKADGSFVYTPTKNFVGTVKFKYVASDGENNSDVVKASIAVGGAAAKRGTGGVDASDHSKMDDHQIPGQSTDRDAWHFGDTGRSHQGGTWSDPDMFGFLNSVLGKLGDLPNWSDSSSHSSDGHNDHFGVPDFKFHYSDYLLF
ncbi:MAG: Ig-like domain-containing protein [Devosia sp.]